MPKTKRKTVRKVKKIKQKQSTIVVVNIDQSRRTRTTRTEPKQQYQQQPAPVIFKPSYGSTENSDLTKAITLLLANQLSKPAFNGGTTHSPTVKLSTGNKVHADTQTPSLRPPPIKSESSPPMSPVKLDTLRRTSPPPMSPPPMSPIKSEASYPLEGSTYTSDLYPPSPDRANNIGLDEFDKDIANYEEFLRTAEKNKQERGKYSLSPRQLSFFDEETGGGAIRQSPPKKSSPPKTPQTSPARMQQAEVLEDALQDYTPDELRKFYEAVFKKRIHGKITRKPAIIAKFDLKRRNKSTLDHLQNYITNYVTDETKNVTMRKKS